jgi:radical SAM superfamily enzyme YgiQ (UPF0313 family)
MADIVIINPRFEISFWGLEHALPFFGKRANLPVAALPLLAALTPPEHRVTLIDENVEPIDFARCAKADIVGVTGMVVQRRRMREILTELKRRGAFVAVGGPWITVNEGYFGDLPDAIFVGEAEETWARFLADWQAGRPQKRYEQTEKTDMTRVPVPRLDLLKTRHYAFGSVQFSRGCPFQCEFCDIIVVFGRRPRLKTEDQIVAELEAIRAQKLAYAFIVDDNLIGNKKAMKKILRRVVDWQRANGFPLTFVTEASIDLADDAELMRLMAEANIGAVFVGIESTDEASLREAKKLQNVRPGGTLLEKVRRIQDAGLEVWGGFIVGFDNDDAGVFDNVRRFLADSDISTAMVGMLSAIPKTPLHERLAAAGRLDRDDEPPVGTNVIPLQMSRQELSDGYAGLMADIYAPGNYLDRVDGLYLDRRIDIDRAWADYGHPWRRRARHARFALEAFGIMAMIALKVRERALARAYLGRFLRFAWRSADPSALRVYAIKCAWHYHMYRLAQALKSADRSLLNTY